MYYLYLHCELLWYGGQGQFPRMHLKGIKLHALLNCSHTSLQWLGKLPPYLVSSAKPGGKLNLPGVSLQIISFSEVMVVTWVKHETQAPPLVRGVSAWAFENKCHVTRQFRKSCWEPRCKCYINGRSTMVSIWLHKCELYHLSLGFNCNLNMVKMPSAWMTSEASECWMSPISDCRFRNKLVGEANFPNGNCNGPKKKYHLISGLLQVDTHQVQFTCLPRQCMVWWPLAIYPAIILTCI